MLDQLGNGVDPLVPVRDRRDVAPERIARAETGRQVLHHEAREIADPAALPDRLQARAPAEKQQRPARDTLEAAALGGDQQPLPPALPMSAARRAGHGLGRAAAGRREDGAGRAAAPFDPEGSPRSAGGARVPPSQSPTAALNASGRSSIGAWPQLGRYTSCEPWMRAWKRSAT